MLAVNIQQFCKDLNLYLMDKFNYRKPPATSNFTTIDACRKSFNIYLRLDTDTEYWQSDTIVVAQLGFKDVRKGNGRDFLKFLVSSAQKYNKKRIGIEGANNDLAQFAKHFGFYNFHGKNWIADLEQIQQHL